MQNSSRGIMEKVGITITFFWTVSVSGLLYIKRHEALLMSLNEWGDFLAGVTAPIAFLWLIIGYMLQRKEMNLNTEALLLSKNEIERQANELAKQTEYQSIQAKLAQQQSSDMIRRRMEERFERRNISVNE